ncbi:MAG: acyltransferase domain-containing protein, partial [Pseudomonadota bacterium]
AIQSSQSKNTIVFLYPGQASQYPGMATALYSNQPVFRTALDTCAEILGSKINIRKLLLEDASEETVTKTENAQPCLFTFEYALTQLWLSWGIKPSAMLGHSLGEWVAACIADVMSLESAINIVAERGRLMQAMPAGAMLAVPLTAEAINQELDQDLVIAAYNAPSLCAISGSLTAIETLETKLNSKGISAKRLHTSHAFHSPSMQDAVAPLIEIVSKQTLSAPTIPFISNVSGTWITDAQATDANYWGNQLRVAVRFDKGLDTIAKLDNPLLIELGPGKTLGTLARMTIADENPIRCIQTQADIHQKDQTDANQMALTALGQAWCEGVNVDWSSMARTSHQDYQPKRVQLPVYPFARDRYSVETNLSALQTQPSKSLAHTDMKSWFSMPSWQRQSPLSLAPAASDRVHWLLFADSHGIADKLAEKIEHAGQDAYRVHAGENFSQSAYRCFNIKRDAHESYQELFADLANRDATPGQIVWLWPLDMEKSNGHTNTARIAFLELLTLIKVISEFAEPIQLTVITKHGQDVSGFETLHTNQNAITGLVQVVGQEYPHIGCRLVDLENELTKSTADELLQELFVVEPPIMSAWRSGTRWVQNYTPLALPDLNSLAHKPIRNLKREGHYVIIGDIDNGLGRFWAQSLKTHYEAKLTLIDTSDNTDNKYTNALYINTPASDETQLQAALTQSVEEFGRISGIFYSSPTTNSNSAAPLALMHEHHWKYTQENKLSALLTLANSLAEHQPDFVCVQSSLSSIIGGIGLAAYAAANHQLEVITCQQNKSSHVPWFAINWDACDESQNNETNANTLGAALAEFALNPDEVWQATERILCLAPTGQIIVSRAPLEARIEQWLSSRPRDHHADTVGARPKGKHDSHERPDLNTEYVAPGDEIEITVAKIWQTSLGIDQVGVNDNFFELGGHSLLAIQVIGKLRDAFPVEIEIQQLLSDNPTVANVAAALKQRLPEADDLNTMAELLQEIKAAEDMEQTAGGKG